MPEPPGAVSARPPRPLARFLARPRSAGAALLCAAALVVTCGALQPATAAVVAPSPERYGLNAASIGDLSPENAARAWATMRAGGLRLVRFDISWGRVEPAAPGPGGAHRYDWSSSDAWVTRLAAAGLRAYPMAGYSAPWAASIPGDTMSGPRDPAQYAAFVAAAAARYAAGGSFWAEHPELPALPIQSLELWNEENAARFWTQQGGAPADYARLYLLSRDAIHRVAPGVQVVAGGLVDNGAERFISGMFAAQPRLVTDLDAIGYHPYLLSASDSRGRIASVRRTLDKYGATSASIELTELGWSLLEMSDVARGEQLAEISRLVSDRTLRVSRVIPYAARTVEANPENWEDWFGLFNGNGTPKLSFVRWALQITALGGATPPGPAAPKAKVRVGPRVARASFTGTRAARSARSSRATRATRSARARAATRAQRSATG